ncbi:hypothetical protein [Companilactobacillus sp. DQM5]|uniref:hypothetical protein n=1 Tax=Companilactobacillus sp. DQM5 TaxID=3463359 RepID=UPI00405976DB
MAEFSYLRPLMTKGYIFDFPSQFTTKQISEFSEEDYDTVTQKSSELMKEIMEGNVIFWFIQDKLSKKIIGLVKFNFKNNTLNAKLDSSLSDEDAHEISFRIAEICTINLNLQKFTISSRINNKVYTELLNYYNTINDTLILKK